MVHHACGGEMLALPPEKLLVEGRAATIDLHACMSCGTLERSAAHWGFVQG